MNFSSKFKTFLIGAALVSGASSAMAQDFDVSRLSVDTGVSSLGFFISPSYEYNEHLSSRLNVYLGEFSDTFDADGTSVDGTFDSYSASVVADYQPWSNGIFISGGLSLGGYKLSGSTTEIEYEGTTYNGDFGIDIQQKSNIAPVISTGYKYAGDAGFSAGFELGAKLVAQELSVSGIDTIASASDQAQLEDDIAQINSDFEDFPVIPFIALSVGWSF